MLTFEQIISMVADAYHMAALANADMRAATQALEKSRTAILWGSDIFAAWDTIEAEVGRAEENRLQPALIRLRAQVQQLAVAAEITRLAEAFKRNQDTGWRAWLRSFTDGLTEWRFGFCLGLCDAPLPFPQDSDLPFDRICQFTQRALHARWAEAYSL